MDVQSINISGKYCNKFCSYREKKLLVGSEDYGKDLTGVQNLRKKHKRLDAELASHEPAIQVTTCSCLRQVFKDMN